jgi:hypothetical protein
VRADGVLAYLPKSLKEKKKNLLALGAWLARAPPSKHEAEFKPQYLHLPPPPPKNTLLALMTSKTHN